MKIKNQLNKWRTGKNNEQMNDAKKSNNNLNKSKKTEKSRWSKKTWKKKKKNYKIISLQKDFFPSFHLSVLIFIFLKSSPLLFLQLIRKIVFSVKIAKEKKKKENKDNKNYRRN